MHFYNKTTIYFKKVIFETILSIIRNI